MIAIPIPIAIANAAPTMIHSRFDFGAAIPSFGAGGTPISVPFPDEAGSCPPRAPCVDCAGGWSEPGANDWFGFAPWIEASGVGGMLEWPIDVIGNPECTGVGGMLA